MFKLIRRLIRWCLYLLLLALILAVAGILLLDTIARQIVQSRFRSETGMDVAIGKVDVGLSTPTISIEDVRIYNPPQLGGSLFLRVPEIYADYDRRALRSGQLHLNLLRINLAEIDFVKDKHGRLNFEVATNASKVITEAITRKSSGFTFTGIDTLNVTLQRMHAANLEGGTSEDLNFGLTNQIFHSLKTDADWAGMALILAGRSGAAAPSATAAQADFQKLLLLWFH